MIPMTTKIHPSEVSLKRKNTESQQHCTANFPPPFGHHCGVTNLKLNHEHQRVNRGTITERKLHKSVERFRTIYDAVLSEKYFFKKLRVDVSACNSWSLSRKLMRSDKKVLKIRTVYTGTHQMLEPLLFPYRATSWWCVLSCFVEEPLLY